MRKMRCSIIINNPEALIKDRKELNTFKFYKSIVIASFGLAIGVFVPYSVYLTFRARAIKNFSYQFTVANVSAFITGSIGLKATHYLDMHVEFCGEKYLGNIRKPMLEAVVNKTPVNAFDLLLDHLRKLENASQARDPKEIPGSQIRPDSPYYDVLLEQKKMRAQEMEKIELNISLPDKASDSSSPSNKDPFWNKEVYSEADNFEDWERVHKDVINKPKI
mmetsp:Transcript_16507/g.28035  ORF Transcript_16507/g.28035 Transcript_16507/m.28035 type:complete len:220 (-) Transcript_16507:51-710(-)